MTNLLIPSQKNWLTRTFEFQESSRLQEQGNVALPIEKYKMLMNLHRYSSLLQLVDQTS
jgi:hypothetical protein